MFGSPQQRLVARCSTYRTDPCVPSPGPVPDWYCNTDYPRWKAPVFMSLSYLAETPDWLELKSRFESSSSLPRTSRKNSVVMWSPAPRRPQDLPRVSWRYHRYEKPLPLLFYSINVYYFPAVTRLHSWRPILRNFENIINRNTTQALSKLLILENVVDSHHQQMPYKNNKHDSRKERHLSAVPPLHARPLHENWKRNLVTKSFFFFLCIV